MVNAESHIPTWLGYLLEGNPSYLRRLTRKFEVPPKALRTLFRRPKSEQRRPCRGRVSFDEPSDDTSEASNGETSPLLRLPLELRRLIWSFAIGGRVLHVERFDDVRRSGLVRKKVVSRTTGLQRRTCCEGDDPDTWYHGCWSSGKCVGPSCRDGMLAPPLALPLCCRQIYRETIAMLYSENVFSFTAVYDLADWQSLVFPSRLHDITAIKVFERHELWAFVPWASITPLEDFTSCNKTLWNAIKLLPCLRRAWILLDASQASVSCGRYQNLILDQARSLHSNVELDLWLILDSRYSYQLSHHWDTTGRLPMASDMGSASSYDKDSCTGVRLITETLERQSRQAILDSRRDSTDFLYPLPDET